MTPVCRSARTLVVPPGVNDIRRFGEGGGWRDDEEDACEASTSTGETLEEVEGRWVDGWPSSASARAFPVRIEMSY